jgi:hypothetical protein
MRETFHKSELGSHLAGQLIQFKYKSLSEIIDVVGFLDKVTETHCRVGPERTYDDNKAIVLRSRKYHRSNIKDNIIYHGIGSVKQLKELQDGVYDPKP